MRVLIVEDERLNRRLLEDTVAPFGEFVSARNGREAVEAFGWAMEEERPFDLVFMDILMPEMNGLQALERIRQIEAERAVPPGRETKAIMITGLTDMKNVSRAFFRGNAVAYLEKPVSPQKVREELRKFGLAPAEERALVGRG